MYYIYSIINIHTAYSYIWMNIHSRMPAQTRQAIDGSNMVKHYRLWKLYVNYPQHVFQMAR